MLNFQHLDAKKLALRTDARQLGPFSSWAPAHSAKPPRADASGCYASKENVVAPLAVGCKFVVVSCN